MSLDHLVGMPVDILTLNTAPVALRYHAICGEVLLGKDEPARFNFLEETWREYFDCQPLFQAFYKDLLNEPTHCRRFSTGNELLENVSRIRGNH